MRFPTTLQYLETLENPDGALRSIRELRAVVGADSEPLFRSGNFGSVFKVETADGIKALKCFTRPQAGRFTAYQQIQQVVHKSQYIVDFQFLDSEIYVFDMADYFPVLIMEWIDGESLTHSLTQAVKSNNREKLELLAKLFDQLATWLLAQPFAHGDLKPDNIMERIDGSLVLIDYDGMFVPSMKGEKARESGTAQFQGPDRHTAPFDKHIDDYSLNFISRALHRIAQNPELFDPELLIDKQHLENTPVEQKFEPLIYFNSQFLGEPAQDGIRIYRRDQCYGYVYPDGKTLTDAIFSDAANFSNSLAAVRVGHKWGYLNLNGEIQIPTIYDSASDFTSNNLAAVGLMGKFGYIDQNGKALTRMTFDNGWSFSQELALIKKNGKYGFIDSSGKMRIPARYDFAESFSEGLAAVMIDELWGYIGTNGEWQIHPKYDFAKSFHNNQAVVELNGRNFTIQKP